MAADLGKIGSEGFGLIDHFYGPCKCNRRRLGAQEQANYYKNFQRKDEAVGTINNREAAMKYHGINTEGYHKPEPKPKSRWGMFFQAFKR